MEFAELVNLTRHDVVVFDRDHEKDSKDGTRAELLRVPPSGLVATLEYETSEEALAVGGLRIPSGRLTYSGRISGLPEPRPGVLYICSRLTAAVAGRPDLVFPDDEVRENGVVVGCFKLAFADDWPKEW